MDSMIKIPRIEDYLAKLSLQMKEFSLTGIQDLLQDIELKKADKVVLNEFQSRISHLESMFSLIGAGPFPPITSNNDNSSQDVALQM